MNTLKEYNRVNEGFFTNVGNTEAVSRQLCIDFLKAQPSIGAKELLVYMEQHQECNSIYIPNTSAVECPLVISPETVKGDVKEIPQWLKFEAKDEETLNRTIYTYITFDIKDFKNLESIKGLPTQVCGLSIRNCEKLKLESLKDAPKKIGTRGLVFLPTPDTLLLYKDIAKYVKDIRGKIVIYKKKLEYDEPRLKKMKDIRDTSTSSNLTKDVELAKERGQVLGKLVLKVHEGDETNCPIWSIDRSSYIVFDEKDNIIGFTTKKMNIIYRKGLKIMTIANDIQNNVMYGLDLKGNTICILKWK